MGRFSDVQEFAKEANRVTHVEELEILLDAVIGEFGFDYYALVHHVDLQIAEAGTVQIANYPTSWVEVLLERRYFVDDPIHAFSLKCSAGFLWSDVPKLLALTEHQKAILLHAKKEGMGDGFTVPAHVPGEFTGTCSFAVRDGGLFPNASIPAAQFVGVFAFEAARRVVRREIQHNPNRQRLTTRQLDCLVLVGQGKSDWEIGKILGIAKGTVHNHIENAKARYDVYSRNQLVVRALFDNELAFTDILKSQCAD